jgi:hypothetical protein
MKKRVFTYILHVRLDRLIHGEAYIYPDGDPLAFSVSIERR